jgi:hypothetical protein
MNRTLTRLTLLSVLMVSFASAAIIYTLTATLTTQATVPSIIFTSGSDTSSISGTIGSNGTTFTATAVPLEVGSNVTIPEAVNLTNTDAGSAHDIIGAEVLSEDFASELDNLSIYVYNGTRYLLISLDGTGAVTYEYSGTLSMPASAEWSIIVEGCYDDGTATGTTNNISFHIKQ